MNDAPSHRNTREALMAAALGSVFLFALLLLLRGGHADLHADLMRTVVGGEGKPPGEFAKMTEVADKLASSLVWPVLAIVPLGGGIGVLMMSVGARMGSTILISSLAGPFMLLFVTAAAK